MDVWTSSGSTCLKQHAGKLVSTRHRSSNTILPCSARPFAVDFPTRAPVQDVATVQSYYNAYYDIDSHKEDISVEDDMACNSLLNFINLCHGRWPSHLASS